MAKVNLDPSDYPSNSNKEKEEQKKKHLPVVTTPVKVEKPSFGRKIKDAFLMEDLTTVRDEIITEKIIPAIKDGIADALTGFIEGILFGSVTTRRRKKGSGSSYGTPSYAAYYKSDGQSVRRSSKRDEDDCESDFRDYCMATRGDAEEVLSNLVDYIEEYQEATVADYLDLIGKPSDIQDSHWGWTNLSRATVRRGRNGYLIDFPKTEYLD